MKIKDKTFDTVSYLDCHGLITPSSGPPNETILLILRKFFFWAMATRADETVIIMQMYQFSIIDLLAILEKSLDRVIFLYNFIREVR